VTVFHDDIFEGSHLTGTAQPGIARNVNVAETSAVTTGQLQFDPRAVVETVVAGDKFAATRDVILTYHEYEDTIATSDVFTCDVVRREIDTFGSQLLDQNAEGMEKAMAELEAGVLLDIEAELIIDVWDPWATFHRNLPFLAWSYDVDLWEEGWSEYTQRAWVDVQDEFKRTRGTLGAIAMALDFAGRDFVGPNSYEIKQAMTPPQGMFFSPGLSVEEHNAWIRLMPEIRIYLGIEKGLAGQDMFWDDGFWEADGLGTKDAWAYDNGWELYGRKAILRQFGHPDLNLRVVQREQVVVNKPTIDYEEVHIDGVSDSGFFFDEDFWGDPGDGSDGNFYDSDEIAPKLYNVRLDRSFDSVSTQLHLSAIEPTQTPINVTYERNSDIGDAGARLHYPDGFYDADFYESDNAALMLADRIYLLDKDISVPMSIGVSFWDNDRWGFPHHTMELLIDLHTHEDANEYWWGMDSSWDDMFWSSTNLEHIDRACRAVVAAKSLRDKALLQFDPWRPVRSADVITEDTTAADWVPNNL
jgi:phage tail P2-like protein